MSASTVLRATADHVLIVIGLIVLLILVVLTICLGSPSSPSHGHVLAPAPTPGVTATTPGRASRETPVAAAPQVAPAPPQTRP